MKSTVQKSKNILLFLGFIGFAFLSGCRTVYLRNGEVPAKYLSQARQIEGIYSGKFDGKKGTLQIVIHDNKPQLIFRGEKNNQLLSAECEATIGKLLWVYFQEMSTLSDAAFELDPHQCANELDGKELVLHFSRNARHIDVDLLHYKSWERQCKQDSSVPPKEHCAFIEKGIYYNGSFDKK